MSNSLETTASSDRDAEKPISARILAGAFGIGLLAGGVLLFGRSGGSQSQDDPAPAAGSHLSGASQDTDSLTSERDRLAAELEALKLQQEIAALKQQLGHVRTSDVSTTATPSSAPSAAVTLDYWNRMNDVIEREGQMRAAPLGGITSLNAGSFLDARVRAAEFAVGALRALDTDGVDQRAVAVAETVAQWYEEGRDVAETGRNLLTSGSTQQRKGAAGRQYQTAEREHATAVDAVNAEGERVRQQLSHDYGIDFPPLK